MNNNMILLILSKPAQAMLLLTGIQEVKILVGTSNIVTEEFYGPYVSRKAPTFLPDKNLERAVSSLELRLPAGSSETSVIIYWSTRRHIPEGSNSIIVTVKTSVLHGTAVPFLARGRHIRIFCFESSQAMAAMSCCCRRVGADILKKRKHFYRGRGKGFFSSARSPE
jgi:hypothetical protein